MFNKLACNGGSNLQETLLSPDEPVLDLGTARLCRTVPFVAAPRDFRPKRPEVGVGVLAVEHQALGWPRWKQGLLSQGQGQLPVGLHLGRDKDSPASESNR